MSLVRPGLCIQLTRDLNVNNHLIMIISVISCYDLYFCAGLCESKDMSEEMSSFMHCRVLIVFFK